MRRLVILLLIIGGLAMAGTSGSRAQEGITTQNGACFLGPSNILTPCPSPSVPIVFPTPDKELIVGDGNAGPEGTTAYNVTIISRAACLPLQEPILLYTLGQPNAAAVNQLPSTAVPLPATPGSQGGPVTVQVNQSPGAASSGIAQVSLEVFNAVVGTAGLFLKAIWPDEGVDRVAQIVAPATPTPTETPGPGTVLPTPTLTSTPAPTETAGTPTATANPTPAAAANLTVQACVSPQVLDGHTLGGDTGTVYIQTLPGAQCVPRITYSTGDQPTDTGYLTAASSGVTADENGFAGFQWQEDSTASYGIVTVTCSLNGQSATGYAYFFLRQTTPPGPNPGNTCPPGVGFGTNAAAEVSNANPAPGIQVTITGCFAVSDTPVANLPMVGVAHFSSGDVSCSATTNASGTASCPITVPAGVQAGYPVIVETFFAYSGQVYDAVSEFTPI